MPRPKRVLRPVYKNISLPENLVAQVELSLWSELEQRVPFGAWSGLVQQLLWEHLKAQEQVGEPKP